MWRGKVLAIFENTHSIKLSQEPCLGVCTYSKRPGRVPRQAAVSLEMCAEWLPSTTRMTVLLYAATASAEYRSPMILTQAVACPPVQAKAPPPGKADYSLSTVIFLA